MNKKTKRTIRSGVRLASACMVLALTTDGRAVGPAFTLEWATISKGGGVLPDGSLLIIGQGAVGTVSSENFTMEIGIVPISQSPGGCNADGTLGLADYVCFVACLLGPGQGLLPDCDPFDFDGDADVDVEDFGSFQVSFGG